MNLDGVKPYSSIGRNMTNWNDPDWDAKTKHTRDALDSFRFWGETVGRIGGDMKEKWGSPRWSADIIGFKDLHSIVKPGWYFYQWSPERSKTAFILDILNNWSTFILRLWLVSYTTFLWQKLFYNIAYAIPMIKNYKMAYSIYIEADWPELLYLEKYAYYMGKKYEQDNYSLGDTEY